jgi:hypothetical protein
MMEIDLLSMTVRSTFYPSKCSPEAGFSGIIAKRTEGEDDDFYTRVSIQAGMSIGPGLSGGF